MIDNDKLRSLYSGRVFISKIYLIYFLIHHYLFIKDDDSLLIVIGYLEIDKTLITRNRSSEKLNHSSWTAELRDNGQSYAVLE